MCYATFSLSRKWNCLLRICTQKRSIGIIVIFDALCAQREVNHFFYCMYRSMDFMNLSIHTVSEISGKLELIKSILSFGQFCRCHNSHMRVSTIRNKSIWGQRASHRTNHKCSREDYCHHRDRDRYMHWTFEYAQNHTSHVCLFIMTVINNFMFFSSAFIEFGVGNAVLIYFHSIQFIWHQMTEPVEFDCCETNYEMWHGAQTMTRT